MKYLALLKSEKRLSKELSKLPEAPFDSFDSAQGRHISENEGTEAPPFCTGWKCIRFEEIHLPRRGLTPGCVIKNKGGETWRRLDRLTCCPLEN
jgi:hypothetical protein